MEWADGKSQEDKQAYATSEVHWTMAKVSDLIELIQGHICIIQKASHTMTNMKSKAISDICTKLKVPGKQNVDLLGSEPAMAVTIEIHYKLYYAPTEFGPRKTGITFYRHVG
uniref:Uncharacterized protein n=1 Tax=Amphimedon queenslandica TaxID=400682 RepID=A0A1X7UAZ3_AMPQE